MHGVPSAGHVTTHGVWHPGAIDVCGRCSPTDVAVPDGALTPAQREVLYAADRSWRTIEELQGRRRRAQIGVTAQTATSLVRRGYLDRLKLRGVLHYQLTERGARRWSREFGRR